MPTWETVARTLTPMLFGYLLGGFCAAYYLVRARTGHDLRELGSGTLGARNAGRVLGREGFVLTLLLDMAKGAVAAGLAAWVSDFSTWPTAAAIAAVMLGHCYPAPLRFRGGKGVAATLGGMLVFDLPLAALLAILYAGISRLLRAPKAAGLILIAAAPGAAWLLGRDASHVRALAMLAVLLLVTHRRDAAMALGPRRPSQPD